MSDTFQIDEPQHDKLPALRISIVAGPDTGRSYDIDRARVVVGRGATTDVRLTDKSVSEFHLEMASHDQGISFVDCGSRNGVRVAGVRVERGTAPPGCLLSLGMTTLRVELAAEFAVQASTAASFGRLVGQSVVMRRLYAQLEKLAAIELSVLIQGETGTGKEVTARSLHMASPRRNAPFVVLDCTTLQRELTPSTLFGHERGAFTGAVERKIGVFEAANGGVLFLDEIGELSLELQPMLLRVLQEREVTPVGSTRSRPVNVRIISATHRDLRALVNRSLFREDLYYRLVQDTVTVPALRYRKEDFGLLIEHFVGRLSPHAKAHGITQDAMAILRMREFPGNLRELQYVIERLAWLADGPLITAADLVSEHQQSAGQRRAMDQQLSTIEDASWENILEPYKFAKQAALNLFERNYLQKLISLTGNNLMRAAIKANLQRHSLRELLRKHGLYTPNEYLATALNNVITFDGDK